MPILGITGGIASGKSTARNLLLERIDADSFDADACARELLAEDETIRQEILNKVHPQAYDEEGKPNKRLLRELIYQNAAKKITLEAILHPIIRNRWKEQALEASTAHRMFIVDIPLLFETKAESLFDRIITVACTEQTQLDRLEANRGLSPEIAKKIIASQMPMGVKITRSHHVIWNDGSHQALTTQTDFLSRYLNEQYG